MNDDWDIIKSCTEQIKMQEEEIKDLKLIIKRLESKLKQCKDCEYSTTKRAMVIIKDHAENIIKYNHSHIFEAKQIVDKCNEVLK